MKPPVLILIFFFFAAPLFSQSAKYTISGFVREAGSGESLTGVNIYLPFARTGTVTNAYGFYSITIPSAENEKYNHGTEQRTLIFHFPHNFQNFIDHETDGIMGNNVTWLALVYSFMVL